MSNDPSEVVLAPPVEWPRLQRQFNRASAAGKRNTFITKARKKKGRMGFWSLESEASCEFIVHFAVAAVSDFYDIDNHFGFNHLVNDSILAYPKPPITLEITAQMLAMLLWIGRQFVSNSPDDSLLAGPVYSFEVLREDQFIDQDRVHYLSPTLLSALSRSMVFLPFLEALCFASKPRS